MKNYSGDEVVTGELRVLPSRSKDDRSLDGRSLPILRQVEQAGRIVVSAGLLQSDIVRRGVLHLAVDEPSLAASSALLRSRLVTG